MAIGLSRFYRSILILKVFKETLQRYVDLCCRWSFRLFVMSAVDHFLAKNFGQYILTLEDELEKDGHTTGHQAMIYSNIACAQLELGLNRKAIKSSQMCIDLCNGAPDSSTYSLCFLRACLTKGKALLASGKKQDAINTLTVSCRFSRTGELYADICLVGEIRKLLNEATGDDAQVPNDEPVTSVAPIDVPGYEDVAPQSVRKASVAPQPPTTITDTKPTPASASPPQPVSSVSPASESATTTTTGSNKANVAHAGAANDPKAVFRAALTSIHKRSIGDTEKHAIKPYFLQAILPNLPHVTGEPLVDDLVCLAYINVNGGNFDTASGMFKLLNQYRDDLPSAHIGAGSIAAMQRNFDEAIAHFNASINIDPNIADAWKRRGQTRAAQGKVGLALKDLNKAIALQPTDADCYNQRGQVHHQSRNYTRALADFRAALARGMSTAPLLNNIGMCEGQLGQVKPSIEAHTRAVKLDPTFKEAYLNIALMHKEVGNWKEALPFFSSAMKVEVKVPFFQAYGHRGLMYSQLGMPALSLKDLTVAINTLFSIVVGGGASAGVTHTAEEKVARKSDLVLHLVRAALCYQTLGQYHKTVGYLDQALSLQPGHNCWFQREVAMFLWASLDVDLVLYNADDRVDPRLKDGWCKHVAWSEYMSGQMATTATGPAKELNKVAVVTAGSAGLYTPQSKPSLVPCLGRYSSAVAVDEDGELIPLPTETSAAPLDSIPESAASKLKSRTAEPAVPVPAMRDEDQKLRLVELTLPMAQWVQLNSPGFLPNRRQHRMFGLSVLQMGAALTKHFSLIGLEGIGLSVPDAASSRPRSSPNSGGSSGKKAGGSSSSSRSSGTGGAASGSSSRSDSPSGKRGAGATTHTFNWRDLYDIGVRWRQVSEPGDPVWWIDRFPTRAFEEGFGLQTPLVNGHLTTVRYAPYYKPAFDRVKDILLTHGLYTAADVFVRIENEDARRAIAEAETLAGLRAAVGADFYVVVPCPSLKSPGRVVMEGTRLTLLAQAPEGFDFTIRTPGKPHRWSQYEEELEACFHRLEETFLWLHQSQACCASEACAHRVRADTSDTGAVALSTGTAAVASEPMLPFGASSLDEVILRPALELFYLWATFAPLSRGTAACGYAAFCGVLLAFGKKIATTSLLPAGKQLDWEAILAVDFEDFWTRTKGWFKLTCAGELLGAISHPWRAPSADGEAPSSPVGAFGNSVNNADHSKDDGVFKCVRTLRDMLDVMCLPYKP